MFKENSSITDTERLDFLQKIMVDEGEYTKKCTLRKSQYGRGYRLHESSRGDATNNLRYQIDLMLFKLKKEN